MEPSKDLLGQRTLAGALLARGEQDVGTFAFFERDGELWQLSSGDFIGRCLALADHLAREGVSAGDVCVLASTTPAQLLGGFNAAVMLGALPVIVPPRGVDGGAPAEAATRIAASTGDLTYFLTDAAVDVDVAAGQNLRSLALPPLRSLTPTTLRPVAPRLADDIAYLQLTSASTGVPRLVAVSNANILANVEAVRVASGGAAESVVTWLPLWHDMGLVGCALFASVYGYDLTLLRPFDFLKRPARWLRLMSERRGTLSAAPDFAYEYCTARILDHELTGVDLRPWRHAFVGAEPVRVRTLQRFTQRFASVGFQASTFTPSYGLAESTLAVTLATDGPPRALSVERVDGGLGSAPRITHPATSLESFPPLADGVGFSSVSVGKPVRGLDVAILDSAGERLPQGIVGEIAVSGSSVTLGYYRGAGRPPERVGQQLRTGDVGFLLDGELFILDRLKNTVIRQGQNFFASVLEEQLAVRLALPAERIVVFERNILIPDGDVVAVVEVDPEEVGPVHARCTKHIVLGANVCLTHVLLVAKRSIPRTTSGKKRHAECRRLLASAELTVLSTFEVAGSGSVAPVPAVG